MKMKAYPWNVNTQGVCDFVLFCNLFKNISIRKPDCRWKKKSGEWEVMQVVISIGLAMKEMRDFQGGAEGAGRGEELE